jgi:photosystem II stability/assembly factor-like uncharacterized protein
MVRPARFERATFSSGEEFGPSPDPAAPKPIQRDQRFALRSLGSVWAGSGLVHGQNTDTSQSVSVIEVAWPTSTTPCTSGVTLRTVFFWLRVSKTKTMTLVRPEVIPKRALILHTLVLFVFLVFPLDVFAGDGVWTGGGPPGGTVYSIAVDPASPNTLYAGTDDAVFKSVDGGQHWVLSSSGLPTTRMAAISVSPDGSGTVFAATTSGQPIAPQNHRAQGIFKSVDGGHSWSATNNGARIGETTALAVDPRNAQRILAFIEGVGVIKSIDGGRNWQLTQGAGINQSLSGFVFHPSDPLRVVALDSGLFGCLQSADAGDTWTSLNINASGLAFDPNNPLTVFAGRVGGFGPPGIFKSTDGAKSWRPMNNGVPTDVLGNVQPVMSLAFAPGRSDLLYAALYGGGIIKTVDGGATWSAADVGLLTPYVLQLAAATPSTLYCITDGAGVWKSNAGSDSWASANIGLNESFVTQIATDPTEPLTVYASTYSGVFRSVNGGNDWSLSSNGLPDGHINGLVISPSPSHTFYALSLFNGVFKSTDSAKTWEAVNDGLDMVVLGSFGPIILSANSLAIDPTKPSTLYLGANLGRAYKSVDGGVSWKALPVPMEAASIAQVVVDPVTPTTVYAVGTNGGLEPVGGTIFRTQDGGSTWSTLSNNECLAITLTVDRSNPSTLYAGGLPGFCKSTDGGASWQASASYLPQANQLLIDPRDPSILYAAVGDYYVGFSGGVFWSHDGGTTWDRLGLVTISTFICLSLDATGRVLYAGSQGGGIFSLDLDRFRPKIVTAPGRPAPKTIPPRR